VFIKFEELSIKNLKLGIPNWFRVPSDLRSLMPDLIDEVEDKFLNYVAGLGYDYVEVEMPDAVRYVWRYFPVIRYSEATATHIANKDKWYMYSPDVRRLLEKGLEYRAVEYLEALSFREKVKEELGRVLKRVDVLITVSQ
jgi:aspartyl-tRNA(Asn)/glutamyl-tRNA(Gln) amidotransferase subunit A